MFGEASAGSVAFDQESGRVVHVEFGGQTWTFDVCANTWEQVRTRGVAPRAGADLFYDPVDDLTYAISEGSPYPTIRFFDLETSTWTTVAEPSHPGEVPSEQSYVMDPIKGIFYGFGPSQQLWAYEIASNTWLEVEQGERRPPTDPAVATFDPTVGRIVLYGLHEPWIAAPVEPARSNTIAETWTFDPGNSGWRRVSTRSSTLTMYDSMRGMTYNEETRTSVLVTDDEVATFDATANRWREPQPASGCPDLTRLGQGLVDDVVNGRVLVLGGTVRTPADASQNGTDVWAYDVDTNTWTELVPPLPD